MNQFLENAVLGDFVNHGMPFHGWKSLSTSSGLQTSVVTDSYFTSAKAAHPMSSLGFGFTGIMKTWTRNFHLSTSSSAICTRRVIGVLYILHSCRKERTYLASICGQTEKESISAQLRDLWIMKLCYRYCVEICTLMVSVPLNIWVCLQAGRLGLGEDISNK